MVVKLAKAPLLRSEYQKKIENIQSHILANLKEQDNDRPHENPEALLQEVFTLNEQLCALIKQINRTNIQSSFLMDKRFPGRLSREIC